MLRFTDDAEKDYLVRAYSDGACKGNPGRGGWGCVVYDKGNVIKASGYAEKTTNQRMELLGAINAMKNAPIDCEMLIVTDSSYVCNGVNKQWYKTWLSNNWTTSSGAPVANRDLWQCLITELGKRRVTFQWVKGHAGHTMNEICDRLANEIIEFADNYPRP